jgi:hypothetical protein
MAFAGLRPFVGASFLAMDVNEKACLLDKRDALESNASKLAPTETSLLPHARIIAHLSCTITAPVNHPPYAVTTCSTR